jgi:hypothetical protein
VYKILIVAQKGQRPAQSEWKLRKYDISIEDVKENYGIEDEMEHADCGKTQPVLRKVSEE